MYCQKCGKELENGSGFCPFCGEATGNTKREPKNKKNVKKIALLSGLVAVVATIVIVLAVTLSGGGKYKSGYEGAVQHFVDFYARAQRNKEDVLAMAPSVFWQTWADDENDGDLEDFYDEFEEYTKRMQEGYKEYGVDIKQIKTNYEINHLTELSSEECKEIEKALEKRSKVNYNVITEGYTFTLELTVDYPIPEADDKEKKWNVAAVKMDGKWYLVSMGDTIMWLVDRTL